MAKPRPAKLGERYRVKANTWMRRYGYRVQNPSSPNDRCAWPGEIGTIEEFRWTSADGTKKTSLWLVFSRGRVQHLNPDGTIPDANNLVRVPQSAAESTDNP